MQVPKQKCYLCRNKGELYKYEGKLLHAECAVKYQYYTGIRESKLVRKGDRLIMKRIKYV